MRQLRARAPALVDPEQIDMEKSLAQTRAALAKAPLRSMPLFVLTHGRVDQPDSDPRLNEADERLWQTLQDELAALVPNSKHVIAERSGHNIHHDQPELVVNALREVAVAATVTGCSTPPRGNRARRREPGLIRLEIGHAGPGFGRFWPLRLA